MNKIFQGIGSSNFGAIFAAVAFAAATSTFAITANPNVSMGKILYVGGAVR